jgi:membrane-associated phospholipid phosphatase
MAQARTAPRTPASYARRFPRRPGILALVAAGSFTVVVMDTAWRGPMTWGLDPVNDGVAGLRDAGWPVLVVGRWLSALGEYAVCLGMLAVTVLATFLMRRFPTAWAAVATSGVSLLFHWGSQRVLTGLNRPMPRLDPYLVPDTDSPLREAGMHLFPSGHVFIATVGWGMLCLLAVPLALQQFKASPRAMAMGRRAGIVLWVTMSAAVGIGRILRQAHGYNDVLAGAAAGCAFLFAGLWLARELEARGERRRQRDEVQARRTTDHGPERTPEGDYDG